MTLPATAAISASSPSRLDTGQLRWATAKPERTTGNGKGKGECNDDPPF
jgi:hypothetical protein